MHPHRSPHRQCLPRLTALVAALLLSGCAATGKNAETRFYLLSPLPADSAPLAGIPANGGPALTLTPVQLPQYLQRPQIVSRTTPNRLEVNEFDNWGGNLGKNMTRVLADNLSRLLGTTEIQMAGLRRPPADATRVDIQVLRFERGPRNRVELKVQWRISGAGEDHSRTATRIDTYTSEPIPPPVPGAAADRQADVAAMSRLLGEFSASIARAALKAGGS